jgi:hypothetical protein
MPIIKFTDITENIPEQLYPKPAKNFLPEWMKSLPPYHKEVGEMTGKKCMPMLDAMMSGYIIVTTDDIKVSKDENGFDFYEWKDGRGIEFHIREQMETHPEIPARGDVPKWVSPWSIETPSGYSCLFVSPLNHDKLPLKAFPGIVDTDKYFWPVGIPFILADKDFVGIIPAGTPIVQIIPFKRENWKSEFFHKTTNKIMKSYRLISGAFRNGYKKYLRSPKSFE